MDNPSLGNGEKKERKLGLKNESFSLKLEKNKTSAEPAVYNAKFL